MFLLQSLPQIPFLSGLSQGWGGPLISPLLPLGCAEPPSSLPALPAAPGQHHHCSHYKCYFPGPFTKFHVPVWAWNPAWHPGLGLGPAQSVIRQEIPLLPVWSCSWCRCSAATHADAVHLSCLCGRGSGCSRNPSSPLIRPTPTHGGSHVECAGVVRKLKNTWSPSPSALHSNMA